MPATTATTASGIKDVDALLSSRKWAVLSFTYSFPTSGSFYGATYGSNEHKTGFEALNATQQAVARSVLQKYASVSAITFKEITESASVHADLRLAESDDGATAWGYYPSSNAAGGDSWYNNSSNMYHAPRLGNYAFHTFLHEIGHNLGLKHAHETDGYGAISAVHDSMEYSVMTYHSHTGDTSSAYTNETWGFAQTPMMYDIAALQHLYGANYSHNSGNTVYSWNAATGEMRVNGVGQGAPGGNRIFMTLWDGGGVDTYDFSNYASGITADLRPGEWSTTSASQVVRLDGTIRAEGTIANALLHKGDLRSIIENATGGAGNDTLIGNDVANVLRGMDGNDAMHGHAGADALYGEVGADAITGGAGNDFINGGAGIDTASFLNSRSSYTISRSGLAATVAGPDGADRIVAVEQLAFSDGVFRVPAAVGADRNGDGNSDVMWRNSNGDLFTWLMDGSQVTEQFVSALLPSWSVIDSHADYDGDGKSDLLLRNDDGRVNVWLMNAAQAGDHHVAAVSPNWSTVESHGDYNGDGKSDVLWRKSDGALTLWLMDGAQATSEALPVVHSSWAIVDGHGDYDGDGKSDLLWRNSDGTVAVWFMDGSSHAGHYLNAATPSWSIIDAHGDYNGDGKSDILWRNSDGSMATWLMNGRQFAGVYLNPVDVSWSVIDSRGDYNGDGMSDILWRNTDGNVAIWLMNGAQFMGHSLQTVSSSWHIEDAHSDRDGDARSDILWRNDDGIVAMWLMNGPQFIGHYIGVVSTGVIPIDAAENGATLYGDHTANALEGTVGQDTFYARAGNDTLSGGAGIDHFVFDTALHGTMNVDRLTDFKSGEDKLMLSELLFASAPSGPLAASSFVAEVGAKPHDPDDVILYDIVTGRVSYDPDGSGSQSALLFAMLTGAPALTPDDVHVGLL